MGLGVITGARVVNVEAEPTFDGSLVLLEPPTDPKLVPFGGDHVVRRQELLQLLGVWVYQQARELVHRCF